MTSTIEIEKNSLAPRTYHSRRNTQQRCILAGQERTNSMHLQFMLVYEQKQQNNKQSAKDGLGVCTICLDAWATGGVCDRKNLESFVHIRTHAPQSSGKTLVELMTLTTAPSPSSLLCLLLYGQISSSILLLIIVIIINCILSLIQYPSLQHTLSLLTKAQGTSHTDLDNYTVLPQLDFLPLPSTHQIIITCLFLGTAGRAPTTSSLANG
ncbi:hypothetical protein BC939DRAFT_198844 [Gamsiella multidivaricata]|uniref:uncharacterized protein n=1 Tax=Gamsiella multidivaricata TaxID=101098 RepID=UPI00221F1DA5|nr:uncharacterized protein BC939DRAFT_198844 [Gamsiella multidivaricata]KAI7821892.1 hypothetical protein BC939DRAFT_198844 [Gamsiella multidivaricata]